MPVACAACGCSNNNRKEECRIAKISFHSFPHRDKSLMQKWLHNMKRKNFIPSVHSKICSEHFDESCFEFQHFTNRRMLKTNAIPTKFCVDLLCSKEIRKQPSYTVGSVECARLPLDSHKRRKWTECCRRADASPTNNAQICSYHFSNGLKNNGPSIFKRNLNNLFCFPEEKPKSCGEKKMGFVAPLVKHWKKDETAALIALYETERCLYAKDDKDFSDAFERNKAYERIKQIMVRIRPDCTVSHIKSRIKYLRSQYSAELLHKHMAIQAGSCTEETYKPDLWCFGLLQFLDDYLKPFEQTVIKTEPIEEESIEDSGPQDDESAEHLRSNSDTGFLNDKDDDRSLDTNVELSCLDEDVDLENKRKKRKLSNNLSQTELDVEESMSSQSSCDREDIFGQYVATEMKALRDNPLLYLQTKQAILEILTSANFELINPE